MKIFIKKSVALFLAAALLLSGCANNLAAPDTDVNSTAEQLTDAPQTTKEPLPDVPQTNESLTIYIGESDVRMSFALPLFKRKYPNIPVEVINTQIQNSATATIDDQNAERDAILNSIMAGKGPDLLCTDSMAGWYMDYERLIINGIIADMSKYYNSDTETQKTLNKEVMDGGIFDGKRYFFPLEYHLPLVLSTQKNLDKVGLKPENCFDFYSFLNETEKVTEKGFGLFRPEYQAYLSVLNKTKTDCIDFNTGKVNADKPETKAGVEWLKKVGTILPDDALFTPFSNDVLTDIRSFANGDYVFLCDEFKHTEVRWGTYHIACELLLSLGETPVLFPIRNASGGLTAEVENMAFVRANSPNKENAYKFIQVLLSEEVQNNYQMRAINEISVSKQAMDTYFETTKDFIFGSLEGFPATRDPMPREYHDAYMAYADEINEVEIHSSTRDDVTFYISLWYVIRGLSYEESVAKMKEQIEFMLSE